MKKRIIAIFLTLVITSAMLVGCGDGTKKTIFRSSDTALQKYMEFEGSYAIFETEDPQEYLKFLEDFDYSKYEIVDISPGRCKDYWSGRYYIITYKIIE